MPSQLYLPSILNAVQMRSTPCTFTTPPAARFGPSSLGCFGSDLKDLWKAHIAPDAQHLFLLVPHANYGRDARAG